jgi:hypothetical protein
MAVCYRPERTSQSANGASVNDSLSDRQLSTQPAPCRFSDYRQGAPNHVLYLPGIAYKPKATVG